MERSTAIGRVPATARLGRLTGAGGVGVAGWVALIGLAWIWGTTLNESGAPILLGAPPLFGTWELELDLGVVPAIAFAAAAVWYAPGLARRLPWRSLLAVSAAAALGWACLLATTEGVGGINEPLDGPSDYLATVPFVDSPGAFLSSFTDRIDEYSTHARSHPPGMVLVLWSLDAAGLGGSTAAAVLILLVAASAVVAVLLAARAVAGERPARAAAPFLVLLPGAVWIATTADAFFMGVSAWAAALAVLALRASGPGYVPRAAGAGLLFGASAMLSYGLTLIGAVPSAVALASRRVRPQLIVAAAAGSVLLVALALGFWWVDGFFAVREQYLGSIARSRPYDFFLVNNLAAFALAAGPAVAIGLARLRDRALWLLVGGALAAIAIADLSGMSKAEVERIWLPFLPWVALATAALPAGLVAQRALLACQAALAIAIQVGVAMIW